MTVFFDKSSNLHPYECDGPGHCPHCDRLTITFSTGEGTHGYEHDPATCALCDPEYDGQPNPSWGDAA